MIIYMVTDGDYSDYSVCGVYSTEEKAKEAKKFFLAENSIDELELDYTPEHPEGTYGYWVLMMPDGRVIETRLKGGKFFSDGKYPWQPYGDGQRIIFEMWARDEKHAIKIANERRTQAIANNTLTTDFKEWERRSHGK